MDVRLAYHPEGGRTLSMLKFPSVRLAVAHKSQTGANSAEHHVNGAGLGHPTIRLSAAPKGAQGDNVLQGKRGVKQLGKESAPALLVSYFYIKPFLANQAQYCYRDWVLDSGAFSAYMSGATIDLQEYINLCIKLRRDDPTLTEIFALDVIGNHEASLHNCEIMWAQGVEAIPCYHYGEPADVLITMAQKYPKIAIGGCARMRLGAKMKFAEQCFSRIWPKKIHGFGFGSEQSILALPFYSVDATNWEMGPCAFGRWNKFGQMSVRGSSQNLKQEVEYYLEVERKARIRWKREMLQLEALPNNNPTLRLAIDAASGGGKRVGKALKKSTHTHSTNYKTGRGSLQRTL